MQESPREKPIEPIITRDASGAWRKDGKIVHWYGLHLRRCLDDGTKETLESWTLCGTDVDETRGAAIQILEGRRSIVGADGLAVEERGGGLVWEYPEKMDAVAPKPGKRGPYKKRTA